jgi:hypothetical protein
MGNDSKLGEKTGTRFKVTEHRAPRHIPVRRGAGNYEGDILLRGIMKLFWELTTNQNGANLFFKRSYFSSSEYNRHSLSNEK